MAVKVVNQTLFWTEVLCFHIYIDFGTFRPNFLWQPKIALPYTYYIIFPSEIAIKVANQIFFYINFALLGHILASLSDERKN